MLSFLKKPEVRYILLLFLITRIVLTLIGVSSRMMLESFQVNTGNIQYVNNKVLAVWGVWDTSYYLGITEHGYSAVTDSGEATGGQANYAFFPLYPGLMWLVGKIIGNFYLAGLIISNLCLLLSAWLLYHLVKLDYDQELALKSVKYLFLFPTAFILSGVFGEALFLLLLLTVFYFAKQKKWWAVGVSGFLLTLSRPLGILMLVPVAYEYLKSKEFQLKKIDWRVLYFLPWFLGVGGFMFYVQWLTGSYTNYFQTQSLGWGHLLSNPLAVIWSGLTGRDIFRWLSALIAVAMAGVLAVKAKKIAITYLLVAILLFIVPLTTGPVALNSMLRFVVPIFPFFIALAMLPKNKNQEELLIIILALLQGFLMVFWTNGLHLIV